MSAPVPAPDDPTPIDPVNEPEPPWRPGDGNTDKPNPARGEESDDGAEEAPSDV